MSFKQGLEKIFYYYFNIFFNLNDYELSNCKTLKSNKQRLIHEPCHIYYPNEII